MDAVVSHMLSLHVLFNMHLGLKYAPNSLYLHSHNYRNTVSQLKNVHHDAKVLWLVSMVLS